MQRTEIADLFAGEREMSRLMRAHDWSATPLGPVGGWPQSLKVAVRIMLGSRYAMWLGWGSELSFLYNDAYARMTLGPKHPWALGRPAREVWSEIWPEIGPRAERVIATGEATWDEGLLLFLQRRGFPEETYHTFSYSPLPDDDGGVGGMLCVVTEDTERAIGDRRLKTLRELAAQTAEAARSPEEACRAAVRIMAANPHDLPFALLYLIDANGGTARLVGATGLPAGSPIAPRDLDLTAPAEGAPWPLRAVAASGRCEMVSDLQGRLGRLPAGVYPEPPHAAAVLPVHKAGQEQLAGFLVAGVSPRRPFDDAYQGFFDLLAGQVATAVANARAYAEERRRAESLAELDRAKTAFFSNVSHEFRTPLTLMLGPVEDVLADGGVALPPEHRERLEVAHRNALRLQKLVNTLLDFSRIEAGRIRASYEPTDLSALTADLASNFRSACAKAGLELRVDCPPLGEPAYVDRDMWEKVVLNLLSNAFKYTFSGSIVVELRRDGECATLSVRDTGTGIPPEQVPLLFERFHRVEGTRGRTQEGTGIGLALVKELVQLHGGAVRAESELGRGSTFTVTIPLGKSHLPADRIRAASAFLPTALEAAPFVEEALRWIPAVAEGREEGTEGRGQETEDRQEKSEGQLAAGVSEPSSDPCPQPSGFCPRILLADDNADMRDYIRRLLEGRYVVEAVADGLAARDAVRRRAPDLVLSDVMMPGLDGFDLLREIRSDRQTQGIPVILLSARAGEEARVEGLGAGADDYLTKPFSARDLLARVSSTLEMARLRREALDRERRLLAEVEEQRNWLRVTLASIGDAVVATDTQGRVVSLNPVAQELTGWPEEEARGRPLDEIFVISNEETRAPVENPVAQVLREGVIVGLANHTVLESRHGTLRPIDDSAAPIRAADGTILGVVLIFRDVTERRRAEQEITRLNRDLQRRVTEFQTLLDVTPIGIAVAEDPDCRRIWSNAALSRTLRLPAAANISLSAPAGERPGFRVFENGRELPPEELPLQVAIATGREVRGRKSEILLPGGAWVNLLNYAVPLFDEAGRVRGGLYACVDVTEQERSQLALREAERRFRAVFNQQFQFMAILEPDGTLVEANDTCFEATGVDRDQVLGRPFWATPWWDRLPESQGLWKRFIAEALRTGGPVTGETEYSVADGSVRHAAVAVTGLKNEGGRVTSLVVEGRDDTDRKRAEMALRLSEQRWRTVTETLPNLVWTDMPDGQCDWLSTQWGKYTGIPEKELLGLDWLEAVIHPDDRERTRECWRAACEDRADYDLEYRIRRYDGQYRWFKTRGVPIRDDGGKIIYWFGTCTDIEDHKRAEEALREADRRKDEFLATLAHELRNPLAPIRNGLQIMRLPGADRDAVERARAMMERQLGHMVRLIDDLLDLSRISRGKIELRLERVELARVLQQAVEASRPLIEQAGHELSITVPPGPVFVEADATRLSQVFSNLLNNAAKYTDRGGRIRLAAQRGGGGVVVSVKDNGLGIPAHMLPRVFEMFTQVDRNLERSQGGLGIGLSIVKRLVEMHGGTVEARSEGPGTGSELIVRLPVASAGGPQPSADGEPVKADGRRILVVDDNRDAAVSLGMMLQLMGNEIRTGHDGLEALELAEAFRPHAVLLDIGMPRLNGYDTARRIREQAWGKDVVLIALTGWGQDEDRRKSQAAGFDFHLVKPIDPTVLEKLLAEGKALT